MTGHDERRPLPLPFRPRPRGGETADDYVRRLAAANHLPVSYLRRYLGRRSYGPVDPVRLAAVTGRELSAILRALPELAPDPRPATRRYTREDIERARAARREKYAAIRRDDASGMSERAIERKHHVGRRTIIKALTSADPPERKKIHREPAALDGLHGHIDAMLAANPEIPIVAIWERLVDGHAATVAYPTLRTYVASRRAQESTRQDQVRQTRDKGTGPSRHAPYRDSQSSHSKLPGPGQDIAPGNSC
jgi:hypothetical protein